MIDIFYKSYALDFELLYKSLYSVKKYVSGYNEIAIIIPKQDADKFDYSHLPKRTTVHLVDEYGDGYLYQQWQKMSAHKYLNAEHILFIDSDCIFDNPVDIRTELEDGKPTILYTDYSKVGDAICWKYCTELLLGEVQYEFMRRLPLTYNRETLIKISQTYPGLESHIMTAKADYKLNRGAFSEFNFLGAWAFINHKDKYRFINTDDWEYKNRICIQFWSHDRDKAELKDQIHNILTK